MKSYKDEKSERPELDLVRLIKLTQRALKEIRSVCNLLGEVEEVISIRRRGVVHLVTRHENVYEIQKIVAVGGEDVNACALAYVELAIESIEKASRDSAFRFDTVLGSLRSIQTSLEESAQHLET